MTVTGPNGQWLQMLIVDPWKCTIWRIYFFNKVLWDFPGLHKKNSRAFPGFPGISRASKIFQGFPGFPGPVQTLTFSNIVTPNVLYRLWQKAHFDYSWQVKVKNFANSRTFQDFQELWQPWCSFAGFGVTVVQAYLALSAPASL